MFFYTQTKIIFVYLFVSTAYMLTVLTPEQEGEGKKGIIYIAECYEITYKHFNVSPLSLNIYTDMRGSKGKIL